MGIRFLDSILSLITVSCAVFVPYFVGHALSSHHAGWAWITAAILALLAGGVGFVTLRRIRSYAERHDRPHAATHTH